MLALDAFVSKPGFPSSRFVNHLHRAIVEPLAYVTLQSN